MITIAVPERAIADALGAIDGVEVVVWDPARDDAPAAVRDAVRLACIPHYSGGRTVYGRLGACPALEVIQIPSAGFEHAARFVPSGVKLANAQGVHDSRVAEMTLAMILASRRRLPQFLDAQRRRAWEPEFFTPGLAGSRALVVGYGSIGRAIAARLRACEVHVEGVGRAARTDADGTVVHAAADLVTLVPGFDVVVAVTPYDESTHHLIGAEVLAAMPDGALVVNVGRGRVLDTDALLPHLQSRRLWAALDVVDPEPLPPEHPLWEAPQCLIVPHVAGGEALTNRRFTELVRRQAEALRDGTTLVNIVMTGAAPRGA